MGNHTTCWRLESGCTNYLPRLCPRYPYGMMCYGEISTSSINKLGQLGTIGGGCYFHRSREDGTEEFEMAERVKELKIWNSIGYL